MARHPERRTRLAALAAMLALLGACSQAPTGVAAGAAAPAAPVAVNGPAAAAFTLPIAQGANAPAWQSPAAAEWGPVPGTALLLNRTPPSFATDAVPDTAPPVAEARAVTAGATLYVRLRWDDPTEERWTGPAAHPFGAGPIYKKPTTQPAGFYDGAAVMVPQDGAWRARFPALVMGDAAAPVTMYFWRHGDQPQVLSAAGRTTVTPIAGRSFPATVARDGHGWAAVFALPAPADPATPLAFAIWDGGQAQRNGDKFFTPWYRPAPAGVTGRAP